MCIAKEQSGRRRAIGSALLAVGLLASAGLSFAVGPGPASAPAPTARAPAAAKGATAVKAVPLIDINSANRAQLKTLPGIGQTQADTIVAGRPYLSKADLASKNVIPTGVYLSLEHLIIARQKGKPTGKT